MKLVIYLTGSEPIKVKTNATLNGKSFPDPEDLCRAIFNAKTNYNSVKLESGNEIYFINPAHVTCIKIAS